MGPLNPPPKAPPPLTDDVTVVLTALGGETGLAKDPASPVPTAPKDPVPRRAQAGGHWGVWGQLVIVGPQILVGANPPPIELVITAGDEIIGGAEMNVVAAGGGPINGAPIRPGAPPVVTIRDFLVVMVPPAASMFWASIGEMVDILKIWIYLFIEKIRSI